MIHYNFVHLLIGKVILYIININIDLGILDYPILIKYPMDLGTITNKFN